MNKLDPIVLRDEYLEDIVGAKNASAVVKTEFAQAASAIRPDVSIFAVEGPGDRCVYYHWIRSEAPDLQYEFFQSGNKDRVLKLFDSLTRDRTGLGDRVYYCVDRDFDDLQGRVEHPRIFVTDRYAVENYIVTADVLNDILALEFHCNGLPQVRLRVIELFERVYGEHLIATREMNFRAYVEAVLKMARVKPYPERINQICKVELTSVTALDIDPSEVILWGREVAEDEVQRLRAAFEGLKPEERYRGKFALCFFVKWLDLLRSARLSKESELFAPAPPPENRVPNNFSLETLAPKAVAPESFRSFVAQIP